MFEFYYTVSSSDIRSYMPAVPVLFPASSFVRKTRDGSYRLKVPNIPSHVTRLAADCGGFVATFRWGDYRYTADQYVSWLEAWQPHWAAMMDYCCEDEITSGHSGVVRERQQRTTDMAQHMWASYRDAPWIWVPTIQGWNVDDYRFHAREMKPLIEDMQAHYGLDRGFRVGIGTLCRRASEQMIRDVVNVVANELQAVPLHLWGVKLSYLQSSIGMSERVESVDSAAWNGLFMTGRERYHASGLTQREYIWGIAHPAYSKKVESALSQMKQKQLL